DKKHDILERYAPICDRITTAECRKNRWISQMVEYNLGVEMSDEDRELYSNLRKEFQKNFDKFESDFDIMKVCAGSIKPKMFWSEQTLSHVFWEPPAVRRARLLGWRGNSTAEAYRIMQVNVSRPRGKKVPIWGGDIGHPYHPERIQVYALNGMRLMREMKDFIHKMKTKIDVAERLIKTIKMKTITFSELVSTADELAYRLRPEAVTYHSGVK